jgi:hypothetical protein
MNIIDFLSLQLVNYGINWVIFFVKKVKSYGIIGSVFFVFFQNIKCEIFRDISIALEKKQGQQ